MRKTLFQAVLAGLVVLGVGAGLAQAQQPNMPSQVLPAGHKAVKAAKAADCSGNCGEQDDEQRNGLLKRLKRRINNCPGNCWADGQAYHCDSLKATCRFIFGSCRSFFGEPCLQGPPTGPLPAPSPYGGRH
jgi:hypothetical protein